MAPPSQHGFVVAAAAVVWCGVGVMVVVGVVGVHAATYTDACPQTAPCIWHDPAHWTLTPPSGSNPATNSYPGLLDVAILRTGTTMLVDHTAPGHRINVGTLELHDGTHVRVTGGARFDTDSIENRATDPANPATVTLATTSLGGATWSPPVLGVPMAPLELHVTSDYAVPEDAPWSQSAVLQLYDAFRSGTTGTLELQRVVLSGGRFVLVQTPGGIGMPQMNVGVVTTAAASSSALYPTHVTSTGGPEFATIEISWARLDADFNRRPPTAPGGDRALFSLDGVVFQPHVNDLVARADTGDSLVPGGLLYSSLHGLSCAVQCAFGAPAFLFSFVPMYGLSGAASLKVHGGTTVASRSFYQHTLTTTGSFEGFGLDFGGALTVAGPNSRVVFGPNVTVRGDPLGHQYIRLHHPGAVFRVSPGCQVLLDNRQTLYVLRSAAAAATATDSARVVTGQYNGVSTNPANVGVLWLDGANLDGSQFSLGNPLGTPGLGPMRPHLTLGGTSGATVRLNGTVVAGQRVRLMAGARLRLVDDGRLHMTLAR